jgi:hypothetical protein
MSLVHEISIRGLKLVDIGYLFMVSSVIGYIFARLLSKIFKFDKSKYKNTQKDKFKLFIDILVEIAIIGIIIYVARQFVQAAPFPFDGWMGFDSPSDFKGYKHTALKEYSNPYPIAFFIILFQDSLKAKIVYFTELMNL